MRPAGWLVVAACSGAGRAPTPPPVAAPARPTAATHETPCKPGPPLVASELYTALQRFAQPYGTIDDPLPSGTFGTCTVKDGQVRTADGRLVAELTCGVRITSPGIADELGLQLGARGQDVLDQKPRPQTELACRANGPTQVWCQFERPPDHDTDGTSYIVEGTLSEDVLVGDAARAFFAPRTLVEIHYSAWCH